MKKVSRRAFIATTTIASTTLVAIQIRAAAPAASIEETSVISHLKHRYHGWPTLTARKSGELLLVCSGGRERHVCPFGRIDLMRSHDNGKTWTWPEVVLDGPIDDRDAGVLETDMGTLLVTTFTSNAYESYLHKAEQDGSLSGDTLTRWRAAHERVSEQDRKNALGVWMKRSTDSGVTWSGRFHCLVNSPHGPIQLKDGRLLYAGKSLWQEKTRVGACQSKDDGKTWEWLADIPIRPGDDLNKYHELHAIETADGRIIAQIRNHNLRNAGETMQSESEDGGKTWSMPHDIGVWGLPSHLLRLKDGRLLMSYGHRRKPLGNQARISDDHGRSWSEPMIISGDGNSGDLGYPSTVQLDDGSFITVWYELPKGSTFAQLRQAKWRLT